MFDFLLLIVDPVQREKLSDLVYKYDAALVRYARSILKNHRIRNYYEDAQDVVQNAYRKIVTYINAVDFNKAEEKLKGYMYVIVRNSAYTFMRKNVEHDSFDECSFDPDAANDFFQELNRKHLYEACIDAIEKLDEIYATPLNLYYRFDFSVKDISEMIEVPVRTVYTRLERGVSRVREKLKKLL